MATTATLHPDIQRFPVGTTVKAYKRSNFPAVPANVSGTPQGSQDASATVASDGSVSFTGLTDGTKYVLYASVSGQDVYSSFSTTAADTTVTPSDGSVTAAKVAATLKPSGSAATSDEALRALGTAAGTAAAGDDARFSGVVGTNTQTADYTLVLADAGKAVEMNSASAHVITIPPNSSVAFPVGTVIELARIGAGSVTITPGSGVTIPNRLEAAGTTSRTITSQYSAASIRKRATNEWVLAGDIS